MKKSFLVQSTKEMPQIRHSTLPKLGISLALVIGLFIQKEANAQVEVIPGEYVVRATAVENGYTPLSTATTIDLTVEKDVGEGRFIVYSQTAVRNEATALKAKGLRAAAAKVRTRSRSGTIRRRKGLALVSDAFCRKLLKQPGVETCSPNYIIKSNLDSNDRLLRYQWALGNVGGGINARAAWDLQTSSRNVVVAVMDTGVDYLHPELRDNMWKNPGETDNNRDDDGNGLVDDLHGVDGILETGDPWDQNGHGTHVAGIIGARGNNGVGMAGVNWETQIMGVRFLDKKGEGTLESALISLDYIDDMLDRGINIRVLNASWGSAETAEELFDSMKRLTDRGVIIVAAAGNESSNNDLKPAYPANYPFKRLVSVASVEWFGMLSFFSNYGKSVDIAAPGGSIGSTWPNGRFRVLSGTSMAAPHVSGALALLFGKNPQMSSDAAVAKLYSSAKPNARLRNLVVGNRQLELAALLR